MKLAWTKLGCDGRATSGGGSREKLTVVADADWRDRRHLMRIHQAAIRGGERVLLADDWAERGSQASVARRLIEACGGVWAGASLIVDQLTAKRSAQLAPVWHIVTAEELGPAG